MPNFFERHSDTLITIATIAIAFLGLVAIIDQRFNAQEKLITQRFNAVDQRFEAVDQRFGAVAQRFGDQDKRIDQRFDTIDQRFGDQDKRIDQRFDTIDQRFDAIDQRFDAQDKRIDRLFDEVSELRKLMVGIIERVSRNEGEIDVIREQLQIVDAPSP